jgi:hypothetical protein
MRMRYSNCISIVPIWPCFFHSTPKKPTGEFEKARRYCACPRPAGEGLEERCVLISTECRDSRRTCESGRADPEIGVPVHGIEDWFRSIFGKPDERGNK